MSASRRRIGSDLRKVDAHVIRPEEYDDAPELTADQIASADVYVGDKLVRRGRPPKENPKEAIKLRLSPDVLDHFRAGGPGWQTRINDALERIVKREKRTATRRYSPPGL